jgi:NADPH-dependent 2,4-dienoyl-CoA reductase/sulfur reductase-like enzyme
MTQPRDIVIVGAGPAGIAAACVAAECGGRVTIIDDNPATGGQIWRGEVAKGARHWLERLTHAGVELMCGARVVDGDAARRTLLVEGDQALRLKFEKLILATGARERFLPFPGWTLPGVMGAGGLQALVKTGLPIEGKRVVVAGSGPLLLAVAAALRKRGARILLIAEQAPITSMLRFAGEIAWSPSKLAQSINLGTDLAGVPFRSGTWVERANGDRKLETVHISNQGADIPCDYLAVGFGLVPNTELAMLLGCDVSGGFVKVNAAQCSTVPGIYCAGEITGIGGVEAALVEGQIAGAAAAGQSRHRKMAGHRRFEQALARAFALRPEVRRLADDNTIVCRCEDVRLGALRELPSWRHAKLHTRCGMGPCQGRVCGPATEMLFGWQADSVRPPVLPARIETLASDD